MVVACQPRHPVTSVDEGLYRLVEKVIITIDKVCESIVREYETSAELRAETEFTVLDGRLSAGLLPAWLCRIGFPEVEDGVQARSVDSRFKIRMGEQIM